MPKSRGIKPEVIKREINLVNTIQSVSLQTNGSATSSGSAILGGSATPGGGAIDWKKKYKDEFDKRFAIEEQFDDLQTQVLNNPTNDWFERTNVLVLGSLTKAGPNQLKVTKNNPFLKFAHTNRLYSDQIEKNVALKKQIANQSKEMEELKTNQMSEIPPLRPKLEIPALEPRVDLTIDSTEEDENESLKSKIEEIEGRDSQA